MQSPPAEPAAISHSLEPGLGFDPATHRFRYYDFVMAAFVTVLLLSNVLSLRVNWTVFLVVANVFASKDFATGP